MCKSSESPPAAATKKTYRLEEQVTYVSLDTLSYPGTSGTHNLSYLLHLEPPIYPDDF